jgi:hypothetical protein
LSRRIVASSLEERWKITPAVHYTLDAYEFADNSKEDDVMANDRQAGSIPDVGAELIYKWPIRRIFRQISRMKSTARCGLSSAIKSAIASRSLST